MRSYLKERIENWPEWEEDANVDKVARNQKRTRQIADDWSALPDDDPLKLKFNAMAKARACVCVYVCALTRVHTG